MEKQGSMLNNHWLCWHLADSSVLFTGFSPLPAVPNNPPVSGAGTRLMWYPDKAAFRSGRVEGAYANYWNKDSIGVYSFAYGLDTKAMGLGAIAGGNLSSATGFYAIGLGYNTRADGFASVALGQNTRTSGGSTFAIGEGTHAYGNASMACGESTTARGENAVSFGLSTIARSYLSFVVGRYNDTTNIIETSGWITKDPLFVIGIGSANNARKNAMTVLKNGRTGINTAMPLAKLHVADSSVIFTGFYPLPGTPANPPATGQGTRMMWYPDKGAFRAGTVQNTHWDKDSIGNYSVAFGFNTIAKGTNAIATGVANTASGNSSATCGIFNKAIGDYAIATGNTSTATGISSMSLGELTMAIGTNAVAMHFRTIAKAYACLAIGRYNDTMDISSTTSWVATDPVFIIGNGSASNSRSNAMTVLKNGNVGIGISSPAYPLHVVHNINSGGGFDNGLVIEANSASTGEAAVVFKNHGANGSGTNGWIAGLNESRNFSLAYGNSFTGVTTKMFLDSLGNMGIGVTNPGYLLEVNGTAGKPGGGSWTNSSDARLKKDIHPYTDGLQSILQINPITYHYNALSGYDQSPEYVGVIAQELKEVAPYMVSVSKKETEDGTHDYLQVDNSAMTYMLINAIKEQQQMIETLTKRIEELEKEHN
jgi:hypothetical protein